MLEGTERAPGTCKLCSQPACPPLPLVGRGAGGEGGAEESAHPPISCETSSPPSPQPLSPQGGEGLSIVSFQGYAKPYSKPSHHLPVRLGLREIRGFPEADAARIMAARQAGGPFRDAEDLKRRARLNARAMDLLANADALRSMALDRRAALWQAKGLAESALPLFAHLNEYGPEADPALPEMPLCEHVVHDYAALRLSLKAHPVSFLRPDLAARRFLTARDLAEAPNGRMLDLAGLVLVRQKPGTAKGVLFVTLEDETGSANLIVWPKVFERFRRTVLGAKLLHVRGQLQREGQVIHVIARSLTDMTHRLGELSDANPDEALPFENTWARADEVRAPAEDPRAQAHQKHEARTRRVAEAFTRGRNFH
ncbi:MAG: hypothetical protein MUF14_03215 [Hyphomonadaceae bacterium]|nr:hypothetical protein [Hyphomonadaceae bacterium]